MAERRFDLRRTIANQILYRLGNRRISDAGTYPLNVGAPPRMHNPDTGLGGAGDKSTSITTYDRVLGPYECDVLYRQSWAAQKMIDIPVDDMLVPGRRWTRTADNGAAVDAMEEADEKLEITERLMSAMKAGRLYGDALMVVVTKDPNDDLAMPMEPEKMPKDGISHLWIVNRFNATIANHYTNIRDPRYGQPYQYRISPRQKGPPPPDDILVGREQFDGSLMVHSSRVLRFSGRKPLSTDGWYAGGAFLADRPVGTGSNWWHQDWGISELTQAVDEIVRDASIHQGVGHLVHVASVFILKIQAFKEALKGRTPTNEPTIEELVTSANNYISNYKIFAMDAEDEAERVTVSFAGLPQIMDRMAARLASIADIPATRFLSQSPAGMDATGDSDMFQYAVRVAALRERLLLRPLRRLDTMVARHMGVERPDYEWQPILNISPREQADVLGVYTKAAVEALKERGIDEDEFRNALRMLPFWNHLPKDFSPPLDPQAPPMDPRGAGNRDPGPPGVAPRPTTMPSPGTAPTR